MLVSLSLLSLLACSPDAANPAKAEAAAQSLRYGMAEPARHRPRTEMTGTLDPVQSVQLGFDVPGRIERLLVQRGDRVASGQALAQLDDRIATSQAQQAAAAVASAEAQLAAGEANFSRAKKLKEAGAMSDQDWSNAEAGILAGRAGVDQARAAHAMARTNLAFHTLRAPFAGVVQNGPDNPGILVGAGTPMFLIDDLSSLRMKGTASEGVASWIREGLDATVYAGSPGLETGVPGRVAKVLPSLDMQTRRLPVEVVIESPPETLKAHGFARVAIEGASEVDAWKVPKAALVARPDFSVFIAEGGAPKRLPVTVLDDSGEYVIVTGALTLGAQVVLNPPHGLGE